MVLEKRFDFDDKPDPATMTEQQKMSAVSDIVVNAHAELKALGADCFVMAQVGQQTAMQHHGSIPWTLGCFSIYGAMLHKLFFNNNSGAGKPFGG